MPEQEGLTAHTISYERHGIYRLPLCVSRDILSDESGFPEIVETSEAYRRDHD